MSVAAETATRIDLLTGCVEPHCWKMAGELKAQLDPDYSRGAALLDLAGYAPRKTARRRAARASSLGYRFDTICRADHNEDIFQINTSALRRQGRPMSDGYRQRPRYGLNPILCPMHHVYTYGVLDEDRLVAYLWLYRCGDLALVSQILGHADHLTRDVMYLLFLGTAEHEHDLGGTMFYNLWDSGTDGLRFFKTRLGFERGNVEWQLA